MLRQCARPTCSAPAATTLSYDYSNRVVWLDPLQDDPHPARHDLCSNHGRRLSVPNGWRLENRLGADPPGGAVRPTVAVVSHVSHGTPGTGTARLVESQGS